MKRKYLLFSLLLAGSSLYAQEWPAVRPEARPATRWWWLGSAVDATISRIWKAVCTQNRRKWKNT